MKKRPRISISEIQFRKILFQIEEKTKKKRMKKKIEQHSIIIDDKFRKITSIREN